MNVDKPVEIIPTVSTKQIKEIISRISRIPIEELDDDVRIREDLGVDSIMAMEIIATLEVKLGFTFEAESYSCIDEVGEFIEMVQKHGTGRNEG